MYEKKITMAYPHGKMKAFTMTYDDGNDCDIRLVELMRKYGVRGTFNINSGCCPDVPKEPAKKPWRRMTMQECLETYGDDMEIAVHGVSHPFWNGIPTPQAVKDILVDKRELERATGKIIRGAAYPYGGTDANVCEILRLCDFAYCRLTGGTGNVSKLPEDPYRWVTTCKHTDPRLMELAKTFVEERPPFCAYTFSVWGHSYEFVRDDNWHVIEELLQYVGGHDDEVWYCTNIELFDYIAAAKSLIYDVNETMVCNPTATTVWVRIKTGGKEGCDFVEVPSGETVKLP